MGQSRKKIWLIVAAIVALLLIIAGVLVWKQKDKDTDIEPKSKTTEGDKMTAMYVPYGENGYIMVNQENGTAFTVTMPEELYNSKGEKIKPEDLKAGNILDIYGNGIMLESYPGQYPGVTKMEVVKEGTPSDADQYQEIVDGIYQEPEPGERPFLSIDYRTTDAAVSVSITSGGYKWSYTDKEGQVQSEVADSLHVLAWEEINDIVLKEPTDLTLNFTKEPQKITVERWNSSLRGTQADMEQVPAGEPVVVDSVDGKYVLKNVESGYVYSIKAEWENGEIEFGFLTR